VGHLIRLAGHAGRAGAGAHPLGRQRIAGLLAEERIREWTNLRVRMARGAGRPAGPESSVGKVHQGALNQRIQLAATSVLGLAAIAWEGELGEYAETLPYEVRGMLRSRAHTLGGGTPAIDQNILGERVLGLPREPDEYASLPWKKVPRS
jgi:alkylation response protein AidB-like acyl-CoA dehydrogenase